MTLIRVTCPYCHTRYSIRPDLRGQPMRCPNPPCRQVFTIRQDGETPPDGGEGDRPDGPEPNRTG